MMTMKWVRFLALASLLTATPSSARTIQQDLPRRDPDAAWPAALDPTRAEAFNHNRLTMEQSCDII